MCAKIQHGEKKQKKNDFCTKTFISRNECEILYKISGSIRKLNLNKTTVYN